MAAEVSQTLEYRGGQLNVAPVLEFKNILLNGPYGPLTAGQRKPKGQWTADGRKAANLDQQLKSVILFATRLKQNVSLLEGLQAEVPQTLEYRGGQLNVATWYRGERFSPIRIKKRKKKKNSMCHIIGIEPQFKNILLNGPYGPLTAGQRKPKGQWTADGRKAANLDQQLKSVILFATCGFLNIERGFLSSNSKVKKNTGGRTKKNESFLDLAKRVTNIDRKIIGKDGKPLMTARGVHYQAKDDASEQAKDVGNIVEEGPDGKHVSLKSILKVKCSQADSRNNANRSLNVGEHVHDLATTNEANGGVKKYGAPKMVSDSFANILKSERVIIKVNFSSLRNEAKIENYDLVLPKYAMDDVKRMYDNTLVGYFVGKSLAFLVVQSYVNNTRGKFGLQKLLRNNDGVYLFKISSLTGVEQVLEREVTKVPVWVKLHGVPVLAYSDDGLSLIATQRGKPIILDAFTSSICVESWGRISFARALIEVSSDSVLKNDVVMAILNEEGNGYTKEVIRVEYKWKPPHCVDCKIFGHSLTQCPKRGRKNKGKKVNSKSRPIDGIHLNKPKESFYRAKASSSKYNDNKEPSPSRAKSNMNTLLSNSFDVLNAIEEDDYGTNDKGDPNVSAYNKPTYEDDVKAQEEGSLWPMEDLVDESDEDEVFLPDDDMPIYMSSTSRGCNMDEDDLDCYNGYEAQVYDLPEQMQAFCDHYDICVYNTPKII
ncbi:putative reverse transcriptase domain, reverse transcriptase zinc-binding domain protein [Tanacetum coccineum]|uniref:Reverse transcriptase domain, reverse transcriptase zinc-binding domain protein n=1 Tax=Tanacetum coccineum TaxID=301880 RepID=A0ABQ5DJB1_9ASTR